MKKQLLLLTGCPLLAILLVLTLNLLSERATKSGFFRSFPPSILGPRCQLDLGMNSYYIAGLTEKNIYLGNVTAADHLIRLDYGLEDSVHILLRVPGKIKIVRQALRVSLDNQSIYMTENITGLLINSILEKGEPAVARLDSIQFDLAAPISPTSMLIRTYDKASEQNILSKVHLNPVRRAQELFLEKQVDGVFCTDGKLCYNSNQSRALYTYYYRNQFMLIDSNAKLIRKINTIDTISKAQLRVAQIKKRDYINSMLSSPAVQVNKNGCLSGDLVFIESARKAENEPKELFEHSTVIDVYSISRNRYLFSFYLPMHAKGHVKDFAVHNKTIVALYKDQILTFQLDYSSISELSNEEFGVADHLNSKISDTLF